MKALLLAAGLGERMRPLTDHTPKPLLQAGGQALIDYHLQACERVGIVDIVINHAWLGEQIETYVGDGRRYGLRVQYSREGTPLETLGGILRALPMLGDDFITINTDIWTDFDLAPLACCAWPQNKDRSEVMAKLILVDNPAQHAGGDFSLHQGLAADSGETRYTFAGIARYRAGFFLGCAQGKAPLAPLLRAQMQNGAVAAEHYAGHWFDIGTPQRLQDLDRWLQQRDEKHAHIETNGETSP